MAQWTFITNHGAVLALVAKHSDITIREIAVQLVLTERPIRRILADLEASGYLHKQRIGRNNRYEVNLSGELRREGLHEGTVGALIQLLNDSMGSE